MKNQIILACGFVLCGAIAVSACDGQTPSDSGSTSSSSASSSSGGEGGAGGAGGAGGNGGANCVSDPKTHIEIINACTDAEKVDKVVKLPLLNPDGTLPPLP